MIKGKLNPKASGEQKRNNSIGQSSNSNNNSQFPYNQYNSSAKKNSSSSSAWSDAQTLKKFANFEDVKKMQEYNFQENSDQQQTLNGYNMMSAQKGDNQFANSINQEQANSFSTTQSQAARLQDLCPEDKKKIGELIKKLAQEKEEKDKLQQQLDENQKQYQQRLSQIYKQNEEIAKDSEEISQQFSNHLVQLKNMQSPLKDSSGSSMYQKSQQSQYNESQYENTNNNQNPFPNYQTTQSYHLASNYSSQFQNTLEDKENSNQFNMSQPSISQTNDQSLNNTSQREMKKSFPLPKPPQMNATGQNKKTYEESMPNNERNIVQTQIQNNIKNIQNEQSSTKMIKKQQNSSDSSEEEDELEIAKKWRTLKKSRDNSLNGSFTGVRGSGEKQIESEQPKQVQPAQKIDRLQQLSNRSPSDKKPKLEEDLNNKIEEKAKNINNLDVDEIKQLNTYLLQKLKQLNQQEVSKSDTPKFQSNASMQSQQIQYSGFIQPQKTNLKPPPQYQFNEDNEEEESYEQEKTNKSHSIQHQKQKQSKNEVQQHEQSNIIDVQVKQQKLNHYESKYQKLKQQHKDQRDDSSEEEDDYDNDNDDSQEQYSTQKIKKNVKALPVSKQQIQKQQVPVKSTQNNLFNQRNKQQEVESSESDFSNKKRNQNEKQVEYDDQEDYQGREHNHQVDISDNSLFQTMNHKSNTLSNNTFLLSGLSTPFPEKMNVEPDFLQSLKNYKMAFNNDQDDSYMRTNIQKSKNKIPQSPSSQKNSRQNKIQYPNQRRQSGSKDIKREITEAIEEIDEDEAREIMLEILNQKKKLNQSKNSIDSRQHSRQSSSSKISRKDTQQKQQTYKRSEFSDYEDDQYEHEDHFEREQQQRRIMMQQKIDQQLSQMSNCNSVQHNQSIQKKTKVDEDDVNLISLLNDDDGDDNLLDLVQKIEEDELVKKMSRGNNPQHRVQNSFKQPYTNNQLTNPYTNPNIQNNRLLRNQYQY